MSIHIIVDNISEYKKMDLLYKIKKLLFEKFNLKHSTIQMVSENESKSLKEFSVHRN